MFWMKISITEQLKDFFTFIIYTNPFFYLMYTDFILNIVVPPYPNKKNI